MKLQTRGATWRGSRRELSQQNYASNQAAPSRSARYIVSFSNIFVISFLFQHIFTHGNSMTQSMHVHASDRADCNIWNFTATVDKRTDSSCSHNRTSVSSCLQLHMGHRNLASFTTWLLSAAEATAPSMPQECTQKVCATLYYHTKKKEPVSLAYLIRQ